MSRLMLTISDELDIWLTETAKINGLPKATYSTMLLNQAKHQSEVSLASSKVIDFMANMTIEERELFFRVSSQKGNEQMNFTPDEVEQIRKMFGILK